MKDFQRDFLEFVIANDILRFGEFTLKSGRVSPYFFDAGLFNTGSKLAFLAGSYAAAIAELETEYDVLFGPAYKGIPLVAAVAARALVGVADDVRGFVGTIQPLAAGVRETRGEPHDLVLAIVDLETKIIREGRIEHAQ